MKTFPFIVASKTKKKKMLINKFNQEERSFLNNNLGEKNLKFF